MSFNKCAYHKCGRRSTEIPMFRFPINNQDRLKLWIQNSGNDHLKLLSNEELKFRHICARHFRSSSIHRGNIRNRLLGTAVPFHFESEEAKEASEAISMDAKSADVKNEKNSANICRICLRSDNVIGESVDKRLSDFYDEITGINVFAHPMLSFCPLCAYKLRKFYNFKQRCLRSKCLLQKKITNPERDFQILDLESLLHLIPQELGFSMQSDRRGFFHYKYQKTETNVFKNNSEPEVMIDSDLIKTEVDSPDDPIGVEDDAIENDAKLNNASVKDIEIEVQVSELVNYASVKDENIENDASKLINDASVEDEDIGNDASELVNDTSVKDEYIENDASIEDIESDVNDASELNNLDDIDDSQDSDDESIESYHSELEMPPSKSKNKTIKKLSIKTNLSCKTKNLKQKSTKNKKFTTDQLKSLQMISFDLNDFTPDELECIRKCLSPQQKNQLRFRKHIDRFKQDCLNLLDEGKIDLGEVKMTKELFLEMFAKSNTAFIKKLGVKKSEVASIPKVKKFMLYLLNRCNPKYETVFKIDYLNTPELKLKEFESRKNSKQYLEAAYKCDKCYQTFAHQLKLDYHIKKWHNPTPNDLVCDICTKRFTVKATYHAHRQNNHAEVYACRLCPLVTYHFNVMVNHYNQHKGAVYQCQTCLSIFANRTTLDSHRRQSHATSHICTACARSFLSENGLIFHKKYKHKGEVADPAEATLCTECNITFDSHAVYLRHARTAHTRRHGFEYKCFFCKDGFDSIEALRKHKLELNHQRAPKQVLNKTSIGAKKKGATKIRVSDPDKPYRKCPICQLEVPNTFPTSMYKHYQEEHPDVPYSSLYTASKEHLCEQCGKTFGVYCYYLDHKNQHTGAKPYACKECPAQFATRKHLVTHSERHRSPRYQCKQCEKLFLSAANLFAHRRVHIGDRRFKCEICFKGFLHSSALKQHIKGVHNQIRRVRKVPLRDKNML